MSARTCLRLAALFGFLAVFMGAFGAHGLSDSGYLERRYADVDPKTVASWELPAAYKSYLDFQTAVRYHMWHALALLAVGLWKQRTSSRALSTAAWMFSAGIVLFCGSLYVLVIGGPHFGNIRWGLVAPLGGTALLIGWISLLITAWNTGPADSA